MTVEVDNQAQVDAFLAKNVTSAEVVLNHAPQLYANGVQATFLANEFVVTFSRHHVGTVPNAPKGVAVAQVVPVVDIAVSPLTLKDIAIALTEAVQKYEKDWGEIQTTYTRSRVTSAPS